MEKRIQYLDILKAIAIFLVVFCHFVLLSPTVPANLFMCLCWVAVPTFFMVNGALLFARPLNLKKHVRKTVGIYLVLAVWKLIYMLVIPPLTGTGLQGNGIWETLNYLFLFGELPGVINGHLWFIEALLAVYMVFPLFRLAADAAEGRKILWFFAAAALACTNGLYSLGVLGDMLRSAGLSYGLSFDAPAAFQPFGKYGNMLGFFLLGALLAGRKKPVGKTIAVQRSIGGCMLAAGLVLLWGVKWFLSGQMSWDGVLLQEGYRHVPVILMAAGQFLLIKDVSVPQKWLALPVRALASRTLGIFYIHWIFGWLFVNPLAGFLMKHGIAFSVGTNILKNIVLMAFSFAVTLLLEKIPLIKRLVTG